jgi:two-component system KDP operon response regulator KdpE
MTVDPVILIIEDDRSIQNFLSVSLRTNGFKTDTASKGVDGLSLFHSNNPDLILLDLGLPDIDGMEVLSLVRESSDIPVIVVSARGHEEEKVGALDGGADDYVTKPFNINELMARIRVALRKRQTVAPSLGGYSRLGLTVDFEKRRVTVDGAEIHLTPTEYRLLVLLIENSGKVLTHGFISKIVWGHSYPEDFQSLRVCMANIRRKIETDTAHPKYILTEIGVGYRLAE